MVASARTQRKPRPEMYICFFVAGSRLNPDWEKERHGETTGDASSRQPCTDNWSSRRSTRSSATLPAMVPAWRGKPPWCRRRLLRMPSGLPACAGPWARQGLRFRMGELVPSGWWLCASGRKGSAVHELSLRPGKGSPSLGWRYDRGLQ